MIKKMTVGFIFNPSGDQVLLIKKNRPEWQAGKFNGIGGHLNHGEELDNDFKRCFIREVKEECNLVLNYDSVKQIGRIFSVAGETKYKESVIVPIFVYKMETEAEMANVKQLTDEPLMWLGTFELCMDRVIPNLMFLVPFAWYCLHQTLLKKGDIILEYD